MTERWQASQPKNTRRPKLAGVFTRITHVMSLLK